MLGSKKFKKYKFLPLSVAWLLFYILVICDIAHPSIQFTPNIETSNLSIGSRLLYPQFKKEFADTEGLLARNLRLPDLSELLIVKTIRKKNKGRIDLVSFNGKLLVKKSAGKILGSRALSRWLIKLKSGA